MQLGVDLGVTAGSSATELFTSKSTSVPLRPQGKSGDVGFGASGELPAWCRVPRSAPGWEGPPVVALFLLQAAKCRLFLTVVKAMVWTSQFLTACRKEQMGALYRALLSFEELSEGVLAVETGFTEV